MSLTSGTTSGTISASVNDMPIEQALALAQAHWNARQADRAQVYCQLVLAQSPGQADALHLLGLIAHASGNLDAAIGHLRQACLAPLAPAVYCANLAEICRQRGLLAEGEIHGRRAVTMDPNHAGGWNNLGIILLQSGKYEESKNCLQLGLNLQPDHAAAHNNLGNACKSLGQLAEAETHWQRALALQPDYAEPHSNLANLLATQGHYQQAADHARKAIALSPHFADAYINLAGVETARGRHQEALAWLDSLLSFSPNHALGLAAKALSLKKLGRLNEALAIADQAISAAPEHADAHHAQAQVLHAMGHADAALPAYEKAASLPGTAAEQALINLAILLMEQGETIRAQAAFAQVTALFPKSAAAWFNGMDLQKFTTNDPAIAAMAALLDHPETTAANDKMLLHFALGKAYLDTGESQRAWAHLNAGNKIKRARIVYDPVATSAWMKQVGQVFSPALLSRLGGQGAPSNMPVFVLGMPRSGTSLVEQTLASHPAVQGAGELSFMPAIVNTMENFPNHVPNLTPEILRQLGQTYLRNIAPLSAGKTLVVDKMPINFVYAGLIRLILPDARIIHCRRNPVDTCLSCYSKLFAAEQAFAYDQTELGQFHLLYQDLTSHWSQTLPASHFITVDYEAIVENLQAQALRMLDFLGLPWDPAVLNFHQTRRTIRTASVNQVRQPVYQSAAGRWKQHIAELQPLLAALNITV